MRKSLIKTQILFQKYMIEKNGDRKKRPKNICDIKLLHYWLDNIKIY